MWSFRRWALHKQYTLQEYVELQTQLLIQNVSGSKVH
jgi:TetR/AcrR family transcriptional regulator, cholesterol catabolism regulator